MSGASERDEHFLRLSFAVARRSLTHGNHPFGCILVDAGGNVGVGEWRPEFGTFKVADDADATEVQL